MTDIFFSYRSTDRERVRPIHDAFAKQGFEVFWDQEVPSGADWDTWIRQHLTKAKCAVVFWSAASVESDNVRHEAAVAKRQGKLITVLLEPLSLDQFPMGLYSQQAINLSDWKGDNDDAEWRKLNHDIESKLMPPWVQRRIYELEAELVAERARREGVENRDRVLQAQIAKEVTAQYELKQERNKAVDDAAELRMTVEDLRGEKSDLEARAADLSQRLAVAEAQPHTSIVVDGSKSVQVGNGEQAKYAGHIVSQWVLLPAVAALVGLSVWIMMSLGERTPPAAPKQSSQTTDLSPSQPQSRPGLSGVFTIINSTEAYGDAITPTVWFDSMAECEQSCRNSARCNIFTYAKNYRSCFLYSNARLKPSSLFDAGMRK